MTRWLAVLVVCLVVVAPRVARADDPATRAAKRHFERGEKLFALSKFDEALDEYQKAFDARAIPDFLFNIGQCYRNLGDLDQAIFSFKKYLKLEPDAGNKDAVTKLIDELEDKRARQNGAKLIAAPRARGDGPAPPEQPDPIYKRWWFWTAASVVVVGSGIGIYAATRAGPPATELGSINFGK
jgi:tetratricopeptide (TPR) repeat protein